MHLMWFRPAPFIELYSCVKFLRDWYPKSVPNHICKLCCPQLFIDPIDKDFSLLPSLSFGASLVIHTDAWMADAPVTSKGVSIDTHETDATTRSCQIPFWICWYWNDDSAKHYLSNSVLGMASNCIWWWGSHLRVWGMRSTPSLLLLSGPLSSWKVVLVRVSSMDQIDLLNNYTSSIGLCTEEKRLTSTQKCMYECTMNRIPSEESL